MRAARSPVGRGDRLSSMAAALLVGALAACAGGTDNGPASAGQEADTVTTRPIEHVLEEHTAKLMATPGVTGVGQALCDGEPCIRVYVVRLTAELEDALPSSLEGYAVEAVETGRIDTQPLR